MEVELPGESVTEITFREAPVRSQASCQGTMFAVLHFGDQHFIARAKIRAAPALGHQVDRLRGAPGPNDLFPTNEASWAA